MKIVINIIANADRIMTNTDDGQRGSLLKWTNYIKGYKTRWFILENGFLTYYRYVEFSLVFRKHVMHKTSIYQPKRLRFIVNWNTVCSTRLRPSLVKKRLYDLRTTISEADGPDNYTVQKPPGAAPATRLSFLCTT